jgi:hypothetical protein
MMASNLSCLSGQDRFSDFRILWSQLAECVFGDHGRLFNRFGTE